MKKQPNKIQSEKIVIHCSSKLKRAYHAMIVIIIFVSLLIVVDFVLLFSKVKSRVLAVGHAIMAVTFCLLGAMVPYFDLGPHIELSGWLVGLMAAGLSAFAYVIALCLWSLISIQRKS